jgi:DNA-binding transcriptional regulator YiaG
MPNIASVLKEEIMRLARKELRSETESLKKASALYRSEIATLKRRTSALEKQLVHLGKKVVGKGEGQEAVAPESRVRFSAKGLNSRRQKLGLSAGDMGALLGVSAQTIYNWEAGTTRPRGPQVEAIAALRAMGKRQILAKLQERQAK